MYLPLVVLSHRRGHRHRRLPPLLPIRCQPTGDGGGTYHTTEIPVQPDDDNDDVL